MKDQALQIVREVEKDINKLNYLRDYLQHVILREMFEQDWLQELVYHGGTALSMVYDFPRFSEDLDFHLLKPDLDYTLESKIDVLVKALQKNGYFINLNPKYEGNVKGVFIKFKQILYEAGISRHKNKNLNIKLEIDVNPPLGFRTETRTIDKFFPFVIQHHDISSFLAGKMHAILQRGWTKGRDFFDLNYFVNHWPNITPNFIYLNNALKQTGYKGKEVNEKNWRQLAVNRIEETDWKAVKQDVDSFILRKGDLKAFRKDILVKNLSQKEKQ
ncbi:MAG: nucleotidyl transferase AbiEii/AbiGii toxin family protein [Atribacterota bacterium]